MPFLVLRAVAMSAEYYRAWGLIATVRQEHAVVYRRVTGHRALTGPRTYPMLRKPIVLTLHTAGYDEPEAVERQGSLALWAFMSADRHMSVSPLLVDAYLAFGLPPERIDLVPNGIDTARFAPTVDRAALRRDLHLPVERPVIAFVGFFSDDKQPQVLFEAWMRLQAAGIDTKQEARKRTAA